MSLTPVLQVQKTDRQANIVKKRVLTMAGNYCSYPVANVTTFSFFFTKPNQVFPYGIHIIPSWNTTVWVTNKTVQGCTINFGTAPGDALHTIDIMTFQAEN